MSTNDGYFVETKQIARHDPASLRFNLVLVAEGYSADQLGKFESDANSFFAQLFATAPFRDFRDAFNIYLIKVASNENGADNPATCADDRQNDPPGGGSVKATYFDATFCKGNTRRLLGVNDLNVVALADQQAPHWTQILVIVNDTHYGGSGGRVAVTSVSADWEDRALHEIGHSYFGFADEYSEFATAADPGEPLKPNVTRARTREKLKWADLVLPATQIPTKNNPDQTCTTADLEPSFVPLGTVGTFEGAARHHCQIYRPAHDCKMRNVSAAFCPVCERYIRHRLARHTDPAVRAFTTVAAVARTPFNLDLFIVGQDGFVYTCFWQGGWDQDQWSRWYRVGNTQFPPGAAVSVIARTTTFPGEIDLLVTGNNGGVYTNHWDSATPWKPDWERIGTVNFLPGTPVAAASRRADLLDIFAVDSTGAVLTTWKAGTTWNQDWFRIGAEGFTPGGQITAVGRTLLLEGLLDLFITGPDGIVYHNWWPDLGALPSLYWLPHWQAIGGGPNLIPNTPVAAVARSPLNLDLFITGADGQVYSTWWSPPSLPGQWAGWFLIGTANAIPGAPVGAVASTTSNLDLFVVGQDQRVLTNSWSGTTTWNSTWSAVKSQQSTQQRVIAPVARLADHLDIFIAGADGGAFSTFRSTNGIWNYWWRI